jgi:hypothetical protein
LTPEGAPGPTILSFIDPVRVYYEGETAWLKKYAQIVKKPMDFGTLLSGICEAKYGSVEEILRDARLIAENCQKYFASSMKSTVEIARQTVSGALVSRRRGVSPSPFCPRSLSLPRIP